MKCPSLRPDIVILLQFGANDNDDEVRDRIGLYSAVLKQCVEQDREEAKLGLEAMMTADMPFSVDALYDGLVEHMASEQQDVAFSVANLPTEAAYKQAQQAQQALQQLNDSKSKAAGGSGPAA